MAVTIEPKTDEEQDEPQRRTLPGDEEEDPQEKEARKQRFLKAWEGPQGPFKWYATIDNGPIGFGFMIFSTVFFLLGGFMALLMRIQLAVSDNSFLGPEVYNALMTMHGSTMMYLFVVPFLEGIIMLLLPLVLGTRDMIFPNTSSFGMWTFLSGGIMFYMSFVLGDVPTIGWFAYPPLSGPGYTGRGTDFWLLGLGMTEFAGIISGLEIVFSCLKMRAPGMSLGRMPLFAWACLITGVMITFAFTTLLVATLMLELDHQIGTKFFMPDHGGSPLLWQHLFWFFGHPEVYIMFIPATGFVSSIVPAFAKRPILAYSYIIVALVVMGFLSFGLWVHHMFATGLPWLSFFFFTAASLMIAIASGIQVFSWIGTLWGTRPALKTPLLFVLGFLIIFVLGGITGVMVAIVPFDWQVHDTFFIVAHFHYVLIGGVLFPIMGAIYFWMPKFIGRMLHEGIGKWSFWLTFIGFNITFFPMHIMGLEGLPRRVYTYPSELGQDGYNLVATAGSWMLGAGFLLTIFNVWHSSRTGRKAPADPWGGDTVEWSTSSPPPGALYNTIPAVASRHPQWEKADPVQPSEKARRVSKATEYRPETWRGLVMVDVLTGEPKAIQPISVGGYAPSFAATMLTFASMAALLKVYMVAAVCLFLCLVGLVVWLWPKSAYNRKVQEGHEELERIAGVPVYALGENSVPWCGTVGQISVISVLFAVLYYSYFYLRLYSPTWPQGNIPNPDLLFPALIYGLLPAAAVASWWARRSFEQDKGKLFAAGMTATLLLGIGFIGLLFYYLGGLNFGPQTNAYGSVFYVASWLVAFFVFVGILINICMHVRYWRHPEERKYFLRLQMEAAALFWYFLGALGLSAYGVLHISPYV